MKNTLLPLTAALIGAFAFAVHIPGLDPTGHEVAPSRRFVPVAAQAVGGVPLQTAPANNDGKEATAEVKDGAEGFAPMQYFSEHCARCHGPYGAYYGDSLAKRDDASLRGVVKQMAEGPGNAPLNEAQLELETAYHRSLADKKPFVMLTNRSGGGQEAWVLTGEATPDSKIEITTGGKTITATLDGHVWTVTLPAEADLTKTQITATNGEAQTVLDLGQSTYSHPKPKVN